MGREVRMVPPNWQHPKDKQGRLKPLLDGFSSRLTEWEIEKAKYKADPKLWRQENCGLSFGDSQGDKPDPSRHMPEFPPGTATHYMMYETCSEGTPLSPAFATPEELAHWLADNNASAFGYQTASYESWMSMIKAGWAPSAISRPQTGFVSGVEATGQLDKR